MKKLLGVLAVVTLTFLAILPAEARQAPQYQYCTRLLDCLDIRDCWAIGCINNNCEYSCWW